MNDGTELIRRKGSQSANHCRIRVPRKERAGTVGGAKPVDYQQFRSERGAHGLGFPKLSLLAFASVNSCIPVKRPDNAKDGYGPTNDIGNQFRSHGMRLA